MNRAFGAAQAALLAAQSAAVNAQNAGNTAAANAANQAALTDEQNAQTNNAEFVGFNTVSISLTQIIGRCNLSQRGDDALSALSAAEAAVATALEEGKSAAASAQAGNEAAGAFLF